MEAETLVPLAAAERYWDTAAETYEEKFSGTSLGQIRREVVWSSLRRTFKPGQRVLELSCGTGIDAVHLARHGVQIFACDLSPRMIALAQKLAAEQPLPVQPEFRVLANEHLHTLVGEPPFDGAFSNFSGLNCVDDLPQVAENLGLLLRPSARLILCMMGRFVPLEIAWFLAHGQVERAFRRLREARSDYAESTGLIIRRPRVHEIEQHMRPTFKLLRWQGIGVVVPPSYAEPIARRHAGMVRLLAKVDRAIAPWPVMRGMADCVLMEFERVSTKDQR